MRRYLALLAVLLAGCESNHPTGQLVETVAIPVAQSVSIVPAVLYIVAGSDMVLTATAFYTDGTIHPNAAVQWSVWDATRGKIDSTGRYTALAGGTDSVFAQVRGGPRGAAVVTIAMEASGARALLVHGKR